MLLYQSTTSAFQAVLRKFSFEKKERSFPEDFAIRRFLKKFEEPSSENKTSRSQQCWEDWLKYDEELKRVNHASFLRFPVLYRTREELKKLSKVRLDTCDFPKGSEFFATRGRNSVESRLRRSQWSCTYDNFELFAQFVFNCKAMKRAFRKRYSQYYQKHFVEDQTYSDKYLHRRFKELGFKDPGWESFKYKLSLITTFVQGSRFSTVPKNNSVDRPINIEPVGNILTQRQIGNWIRMELKRLYSIDLDTLATGHRIRIQCPGVATIDLKNASDSITLLLCQFLLPSHLFKFLRKTRSEFIYGFDKLYHPIEKISSMGNGFTFELMTLILVALARQFDPDATVFGDDIIISNAKAKDLVDVLQGIGFHVNLEKSFISSPFRESCGANFHDDFGYLESYDFRWPQTIHDCVVFYNKTLRLSKKFKDFERLRNQLRRHIPIALQGVIDSDFFIKEISFSIGGEDPVELSNYFRCRLFDDFVTQIKGTIHSKLVKYCEKYNYTLEDVRIFSGVKYKEDLATPTLKHLSSQRHWAKYEMYLYSGRKSKDVLSGYGDWVSCLFLSVAGSNMRWTESALE